MIWQLLIGFQLCLDLYFYENANLKSKVLKTELLKSVAKRYQTQAEILQVVKNEFGVPTVRFGLKEINVSLTHHGNYGAYAIF